MTKPTPEPDVFLATRLNEERALNIIHNARDIGRIDDAASEYLETLYTESMALFREVFLHIGKCFGAPKAPVRAYDFTTDSIINKPITISEINPLFPYMVNHRLDMDPMRNQFFMTTNGHNIDLAVSSIVTVIVGAQKDVNRAIDKITNKYYPAYIDEVTTTAYNIISCYDGDAFATEMRDKIREMFSKTFISANAFSSPVIPVLRVVG